MFRHCIVVFSIISEKYRNAVQKHYNIVTQYFCIMLQYFSSIAKNDVVGSVHHCKQKRDLLDIFENEGHFSGKKQKEKKNQEFLL